MHRLLQSFTTLLDKVSDMLMDRAGRTSLREDQQNFLDARSALKTERAPLMREFERCLRTALTDRIAGKSEPKADFSKVDVNKLTLVENATMDESVLTSNIARVVENVCYEELQTLNRAIGHLIGNPTLETAANPLAPEAFVVAFSEALKTVKAEERVKSTILKELNQAPLGEISEMYSDLNKRLASMHVIPTGARPNIVNRGSAGERARGAAPEGEMRPNLPPPASPEMDVMSLFRRMYAGAVAASQPQPQIPGMPPGFPQMGGAPMQQGAGMQGAGMQGFSGGGGGDYPPIEMGSGGPGGYGGSAGYAPGSGDSSGYGSGGRYIPSGPLAATPSGYTPGAPIITTPELGEGLARLQAGESGFDLGGGTFVQFAGIPEGKHNVLRDLQDSPLGKRANQLESMTIELVAMLFDFIFETRDLPDGIKASLARLQIPVLKAAMLDGAFFARKSHPSRLLVNALAQAGLGWSPVMGQDDPLYKKIDSIVHKILDGFTDNLALFDELREELETFLADEERAAEANIQSTAEEINQNDRQKIGVAVARAEVERRIETYPIPNFLAVFLREHWQKTLERVYLADGEESESWGQAVATLEDLVWSVQPKKTNEDRRHLVALLPSLLKRMSAGMHGHTWLPADRERFMANLVEAHAAAVKPSLSAAQLATAAVAQQAKAEAEQAKAAGDEVAAQRAEELATAMSAAEPAPVEEVPEVIEDQFLEIAQSVERGMWIEFEADDGQLAFAKLAWVSPLRGTYLFTNRQGQKALSMTADELAQRFREDRARLVEAEPLIDRAMGSVMAQIAEKFPEPAAAE